MSTLSSVSSSAGTTYAEQLAQTSSLKRSLSNIGAAIEKGNVTSASAQLTAFIKANPQYAASSSSDGSTDSTSTINQDFGTLATALSNNDADAAKSAWATIKTDLKSAGVSNIGNPKADTAELLAQTSDSNTQALLSAMFGDTSSTDSTVSTLLGLSSSSSSTSVSDVLSNWLTYQEDGSASTTSSTSSTTTSSKLDTSA
jgi:hypothetical protein